MIVLIIIILIIYLIYNFNNSSNIKILKKEELQEILINDYDNYYNTFNKLDLQARKVKSIEEYKNLIINSPITINENLENIIINHIKKIDKIFNNYKTIGFNGKKANNIKWIIGIVDGKDYENGFPHTRNNIIIISKNLINENLISTLIHEKIHIYQKIYKNEINKYLKFNNFKKIENNFGNTRANPDTDNNIYSKSNQIFMTIYNNNPKNINDVIHYPINHSKYEHPFEFMAYNIENNIINNFL